MNSKHSYRRGAQCALGLLGLVLATAVASPAWAAPQPEASASVSQSASGPLASSLNDASALPAPDLSRYQGELDNMKRMQRSTFMLKQQLEQDKLMSEVARLRGTQQGDGSSPYVLALTGVGHSRQARLVVPGFGEVTVRRGNRLPNSWRIVSISDRAVAARNAEGQLVQLPFYAPR